MIILKKESPILFLEMNSNECCFYEEVNVYPKKVQEYIETKSNAGCGTMIDEYFWSNTYGITSNKIFKKIANGLKLEPKNHEELLKINQLKDIESFNYIKNILGENSILRVDFDINQYHPIAYLTGTYEIKKEELESKDESKFAKYCELFRGRHNYSISIRVVFKFENDNYINLNEYEEYYMTIAEFEEYLKNVDKIVIHTDYYYNENKYYSISPFKEIDSVYTLKEASEIWNKTEGALRNAIKVGKFIENIEWRKSGRITLITKKAMERVYGKCRK